MKNPFAKKPEAKDVEKREIFFFTCLRCGKGRRQSLNQEKANHGLCRKCRSNKVAKGQLDIEGNEAQ